MVWCSIVFCARLACRRSYSRRSSSPTRTPRAGCSPAREAFPTTCGLPCSRRTLETLHLLRDPHPKQHLYPRQEPFLPISCPTGGALPWPFATCIFHFRVTLFESKSSQAES